MELETKFATTKK